MGFFSWHTCDTDRSIANHYSDRDTFTVHMITPEGRVFTENNYEGYGEFGGEDFYALLAHLNGRGFDRNAGIDLCFKNNGGGDNTPGVIYPKFVESLSNDVVAQYKSLPNPRSCRDQGFFYSDGDDFQDDESW